MQTSEVLHDYPALQDAVVVAQETASGECRLIAYVVPDAPLVPTVSALRRFMHERLVDYIVPSAFVILDALPLTHTGKVDRRRLPVVAPVRPDLPSRFVAPRTPFEAALTKIGAEVLDLDCVGIDDPFLDLGWHSLLAMQIVARIQEAWQAQTWRGSLCSIKQPRWGLTPWRVSLQRWSKSR